MTTLYAIIAALELPLRDAVQYITIDAASGHTVLSINELL